MNLIIKCARILIFIIDRITERSHKILEIIIATQIHILPIMLKNPGQMLTHLQTHQKTNPDFRVLFQILINLLPPGEIKKTNQPTQFCTELDDIVQSAAEGFLRTIICDKIISHSYSDLLLREIWCKSNVFQDKFYSTN